MILEIVKIWICLKIKMVLRSATFPIVCFILCAVLQIAASIINKNIFNFFLAILFSINAYIRIKQLDSHDENETDTGCGSDDP